MDLELEHGALAGDARLSADVELELDSMLAEGQGGFRDMMKTAMARRPG